METLNGSVYSAADLRKKLQKAGDFLWEEGPLMSHFLTETGSHFIFQLAESDKEFNRWIVFEVSQQHLHDYFEQKMHGRDLIFHAPDGFVHFIDMDESVNWKNATKVAVDDIPPAYLPGEKSWFEEADFEPHASMLRERLAIFYRFGAAKQEPNAIRTPHTEPISTGLNGFKNEPGKDSKSRKMPATRPLKKMYAAPQKGFDKK